MAGSQNIAKMSPRQKMINLMYIVLTAMLALNVSSDVLNGFNQVEEGLSRTNENILERNEAIYAQLKAFNEKNPEKGGKWLDMATELRSVTSKIYSYVDSLKIAIVKVADGEEGDINNIQSLDNLDAAAIVMLAPGRGSGEPLRLSVNKYADYVTSLITDEVKINNIKKALSTEPIVAKGTIGKKLWEESMFDNMPVVAAVTLLTKLQNDIRYAEGEALSSLLMNVDAGDIRVNKLNAFVIPNTQVLMRGSKYSAKIVVAAVDTTQRPTVYINGRKLSNNNGLYEVVAGSTGDFKYSGYVEVPRGDGTMARYDFKSGYSVIEPMATVSATMMNVLYAGINNPISIAVPGIPMNSVSATMTNGQLTRNGDTWIARPSKIGTEAVVTVTATVDGRSQTIGSTSFRVRKLPDPTAFIPYKDGKGNPNVYKGKGQPLSKAILINVDGLGAAIDDDLLNVAFRVTSFQTIFFDQMGNAMPENSNGGSFSPRQKDTFRKLRRGKRFYISRIKAVGPDGIERTLSPMEVIVN